LLGNQEIRPGSGLELSALHKGGREIPVEISLSPLQTEEGLLLTVAVRDITERKQAETLLQASEERFRSLTHSAHDAIVSADSQGRILLWNKGAEEIFGYRADEVVGQPLSVLMPDQYREAHERGLERMLATGKSRVIGRRLELNGLRKDGTEFPLELSLATWATGEERFYSGIMRDISERKRIEAHLATLNEELRRRAVDLEAINKELEAFTYSVSHDLRAPLRHIDGFVGMLQRHLAATLDDKGRRLLTTVSESARQMARLIDDLLAFSRTSRIDMARTTVDLNTLVQEVHKALLPETEGRDIHWIIRDLPTVQGDPSLLRQVFANLLSNAVKYTRRRNEASIEIGSADGNDDEVTVFVRDNGVGFDMQYGHRLFGIFQRLHRPDQFEGTGIGLANVRRIIHRHGGRTWAEGVVDGGATFYFTLPRATVPIEAQQWHEGSDDTPS
jgi:PAS domain S-box-containing protein